MASEEQPGRRRRRSIDQPPSVSALGLVKCAALRAEVSHSSDAKDQPLRIVLVGKTGVGKSATGNTILGRKVFKSTSSSALVTTECQKVSAEFEGQSLYVVDTPGLFDTVKDQEEVKKELGKCITYASPGPHVFLVVMQAGRFTKEEEETVKIIQKLFGEKAARYTMALFTRGDDLEADGVTAEDFIYKNPALQNLMRQCGGGHHVFNNRSKDPSQVKDLLEKINSVVQRNGGRWYTDEMLEEAKACDLTTQEARAMTETMFTEYLNETSFARAAAERGLERSQIGTAAAVGAAVGSSGGPAEAAVGAGIGAAVGLVDKATDDCVIQ